MWVGFVVNLHQLADGGMGIPLRGGKRLMAKQLLNGAKVGPVRQQMRGEGVPQRVRVQVLVDVDQAHVLLHDATHRALCQPTPRIIEKDRLGVRVCVSISPVALL